MNQTVFPDCACARGKGEGGGKEKQIAWNVNNLAKEFHTCQIGSGHAAASI